MLCVITVNDNKEANVHSALFVTFGKHSEKSFITAD